MENEEKKEKSVIVYGKDRLSENASVGIKGVDPMDIRPPQILLIQKSSFLDDFVDKEGKKANIGDFYHTSRMEALKEFEVYFIFAAKSKYTDRRKPDEGEKDQYKALGVMADDFSLFGMTFRSSAIYTLSKLFSTVMANKVPMYSMKCKVETKMLSGDKGDWYIPVVRVLGPETDPEKLVFLEDLAKGFDSKGIDITEEDIEHIEDAGR